jgi:hypothetical protein
LTQIAFISVNTKKKPQRVALLGTVLVFLILVTSGTLFFVWVSHSEDSQFAESIRRMIGIASPVSTVEVVAAPAPAPVAAPVVVTPPMPEPEPEVEVELPKLTFSELAAQRDLWPESLTLKLAVQVAIRYNGKDFGYMEFPKGRSVEVDAILSTGEVYCQIDGNYLSLSVYETDFYGWFKQTHGQQYDLEQVVVDLGTRSNARYKLGTAEGDAAFWAEIRIWCQQNYESVSLKQGEDGLEFAWLPKEEVPIDFPSEAREIARNYLLIRAKYGSRENYASCEIRHPTTGELLGASAIFIPRL